MAAWKGIGSDVKYFWESLWGLGYDEKLLRGIDLKKYGGFTAKGKKFEDFVRNELAPRGIKPADVEQAKRMATWRADPKKEPVTRISSYLTDVLGLSPEAVGRLQQQAIDEQSKGGRLSSPGQKNQADEGAMLAVLKKSLAPQAFTQLAIKTGVAKQWKDSPLFADVPTWNPLRTDQAGAARPAPAKPGAAPAGRGLGGIMKTAKPPAGASGGRGLGGIMKTIKPGGPGAGPGGGPGGPGAGAGVEEDMGAIDWGPEAMAGFEPQTPEEIRAEIEATYGWAAGLAQVPEIAKILDDAYNGRIDVAEAGARFKGSQYYKTTTEAERTWKILQSTDPQDAKSKWQEQYRILEAKVKTLGVDPGTMRIDRLTDLSLTYGWNEGQINTFLASEVKYDPTKQKAGIFKQLGDLQREYLVPLSDSAKTSWAQAIIGGTKSADDYEAYLRTSAVSMFPALANALEDPNMTVRTYLDPYNQTIAKTMGINDADIDWEDPKFQRFINQIDPKTNQRQVMSLADVQRTMRTDPQYGYADTAPGKSEKAGLARTIIEDFGLAPTSGTSFR